AAPVSSSPPKPQAKAATDARPLSAPPSSATLQDAFLAEVRAGKGFFYNTVVAQAQRIDVTDEAITFTFSPTHRALKEQFNEKRPWLESAAEKAAGRRRRRTIRPGPTPLRRILRRGRARQQGSATSRLKRCRRRPSRRCSTCFP